MSVPYCNWPTVADRNVIPFLSHPRRRQMLRTVSADVDQKIREADAALAELRKHRAEVEAFVHSLNPYSERTRNELIEKLL